MSKIDLPIRLQKYLLVTKTVNKVGSPESLNKPSEIKLTFALTQVNFPFFLRLSFLSISNFHDS